MDWAKIKKEYEHGRLTKTEISKLFCVSPGALRYKAKKEGWSRGQYNSSLSNAASADSDYGEASKHSQIISVADKLLSSISRAADELDCYAVKNKVKTKTVEYDSESGKAGCEIVREDEQLEEVHSIIDRAELRQLVTALKDISEVYGNDSESDGRLENLIRGLCDDGGVQ